MNRRQKKKACGKKMKITVEKTSHRACYHIQREILCHRRKMERSGKINGESKSGSTQNKKKL